MPLLHGELHLQRASGGEEGSPDELSVAGARVKGGAAAAEEDDAALLPMLGLHEPEQLMDVRWAHQPHGSLSGLHGRVTQPRHPAVPCPACQPLEGVFLESNGTDLPTCAHVDEDRGLEAS
jgi:hypothetical protein